MIVSHSHSKPTESLLKDRGTAAVNIFHLGRQAGGSADGCNKIMFLWRGARTPTPPTERSFF